MGAFFRQSPRWANPMASELAGGGGASRLAGGRSGPATMAKSCVGRWRPVWSQPRRRRVAVRSARGTALKRHEGAESGSSDAEARWAESGRRKEWARFADRSEGLGREAGPAAPLDDGA
jgi:hypothetical protein